MTLLTIVMLTSTPCEKTRMPSPPVDPGLSVRLRRNPQHHRPNPFEVVSWRGGKLEQEFGSPKVFTIWVVPSERYWSKQLTPEENRKMRDAKPALRKRQ
jgi:hypothetical protein